MTDRRRHTVKVLLIHPDPDPRLLLRAALEEDVRLAIVGEAESGDEGVDLARDQAGLVLLDCSFPEPADEVIDRLTAAWPAAGVVIHSPPDAPGRAPGRAMGAVGFLSLAGHTEDLADDVAELAVLVGQIQEYLEDGGDSDEDGQGIRHARYFAAEVLSRGGAADLSEIVVLLVSEVLTNAIVHAGSDVLVLVCLIDGGVARVEVTDRSPRLPVLKQTGDDDECGRGLRIVERLSRRWGTELVPGRGKTVWFEVERPGQAQKDEPGPDATRPESLAMLQWETDGGA